MVIYFAFSDECGDYIRERGLNFIKKNPYYIRSTILIKADDWKRIQKQFINLKKEFTIPLDKEVKWSYLWSIRSHEKNKKPILPDKEYYFLRDYKSEKLFDFVIRTLRLLEDLDTKIILTITKNEDKELFVSESKMLGWHLQDIMQRIEMEIQNVNDNLCILFLDPISNKKDKLFREFYHNLYLSGDLIKKYGHIKDSLNIEYSHHSVGIQIADYISGAINGFLRGFENSKWIVKNILLEKIRKNCENKIIGYGLINIPSQNEDFKIFLLNKINTLNNA